MNETVLSASVLDKALRMTHPAPISPIEFKQNVKPGALQVATNSNGPSMPSTSNGLRTTEVTKRRDLAEKIARARENSSLQFFLPFCSEMSSIQMGMHMRRWHKKGCTKLLPGMVQKAVFDENATTSENKAQSLCNGSLNGRASSNRGRTIHRKVVDPDATDVSDIECNEKPLLNPLDWLTFHSQLARVDSFLDERHQSRREFLQHSLQESNLKSDEKGFTFQANEEAENCSRSTPWPKSDYRRKLVRLTTNPERMYPKNNSLNEQKTSNLTSTFAAFDERVHDRLTFNADEIPMNRRAEGFLHELSCVPSTSRRTRVDRSVWKNTKLMKEEARRSSLIQDALETKVLGKKRGRPPNGVSKLQKYEPFLPAVISETSSSDWGSESGEEFTTSERKRRKKNRPVRTRKTDEPQPLNMKNTRHGSISISRRYDIDDVVMDYGADFGISGLPQKIEYKEIAIPGFRPSNERALFDKVKDQLLTNNIEEIESQYCSLLLQLHSEQLEREQAGSGKKATLGVSNSNVGECSQLPETIDNKEACSINNTALLIMISESPSIVAPYPPRKFNSIGI